MYAVTTPHSVIYFSNKTDADNYEDFLQFGLSVVRNTKHTYYFNNGDRMTDVSMKSDTHKKYVLITRNEKRIICERLQKEHIEAIKFFETLPKNFRSYECK